MTEQDRNDLDVAEILRRLHGCRVVVSLSGGKDSAATSLYLTELGIEHERVFLDTRWELRRLYDYLRGELPQKVGPITEVAGPEGMADLIRRKAMFPSKTFRWCTELLKVIPMVQYLATMGTTRPVVNVVGVRAEESTKRAALAMWDDPSDDFPVPVLRLILRWTEEEVIAIHKRHDLRPCSLYLRGARRVGCGPCIYSRKEDLRLLAREDPERIDLIRQLQDEVAVVARERWERDRETWLATPPPRPEDEEDALVWERKRRRLFSPFEGPTMFQAGRPDANGHYRMLPIDEVIAWAKTSRGGRQLQLLDYEEEFSCMRWGMCDTGSGKS